MTPNEIGDVARLRAIRIIAPAFGVAADPSESYDDLRTTLGRVMTFEQDMWMIEVLDTCEAVAVAELDPNAWSDEMLPALSADEIDMQTDVVVREAFEDVEATPAGPRM